MRIEIPDHGITDIAAEIAFIRQARNEAVRHRDYRTMERYNAMLYGIDMVLYWLGPRQRTKFDMEILNVDESR